MTSGFAKSVKIFAFHLLVNKRAKRLKDTAASKQLKISFRSFFVQIHYKVGHSATGQRTFFCAVVQDLVSQYATGKAEGPKIWERAQ